MKIGFTGLALEEGKVKYQDPVFKGLADKFQPAKLSPYYFEFLPENYESADVIAISHEHILDLLIHDIEKAEIRLERSEDEAEIALLRKCLTHLENETPLNHVTLDFVEHTTVRALGFYSVKPVAVFENDPGDSDAICRAALEAAHMMFFYTAGREEVHAWLVEDGADAVTCAAKIHSDLARGFIKADIVSFEDMMQSHSMQDARKRGVARLVDRDHIIEKNTVLEVRFKV